MILDEVENDIKVKEAESKPSQEEIELEKAINENPADMDKRY